MTLQFTQAGSAWACEFEVTDKINLHIENAEGILLYQRTAAGKFALIKDAPTSTGPVFDYDLKGLVYPKAIRVICSSLPTYAEVVSDGEITEIKSQTKEVEVTANGTTQVAPDAGYSYLTGVTVKTNVPQSGGSGGSEGGGSNVVYLNVEPVVSAFGEQFAASVKMLPGILAIKLVGDYVTTISPVSAASDSYLNQAKAAAILPNFRGFIERTNDINSNTTIDGLKQVGATEITEEEFYNLGGE